MPRGDGTGPDGKGRAKYAERSGGGGQVGARGRRGTGRG